MISSSRSWWSTATLSLPLALLASCSSRENPSEVLENGFARVDEAGLRANVAGGNVNVELLLERRAPALLHGELILELVDVSGGERVSLGRAERSISQSEILSRHALTLTGLPEGLPRAKTAAYVLAWQLDLNGGTLRGRRSLYAALGKLELELALATDIPEGKTTPMRVIARDPISLVARPNTNVRVLLTSDPASPAAELFTGTTDERGELTVQLALPANVEGGKLRVEAKDGAGEAWAETNVQLLRDTRIALSSDKTIYQPGQTIELRALVLAGPDRRPGTGEVLIEAFDAKGNKVLKRTTVLDEFGVASLKVPTDARVFEGTWKIRATAGQSKGELSLPVERYNLPKLEVKLATDQSYVLAGQTLRGHLDARYMFGAPVANGNAVVRFSNESGQQLRQLNLQTDAAGRADFELASSAGWAKEDGSGRIQVEAEVTDTAGQQELGTLAIPIAAGPLVIQGLTDTSALLPGIEQRLYVLVADPVGRPLAADVEVEGLGAIRSLKSGANGIAETSFRPSNDAAALELTLRATDGAGRRHQRSLTLARATTDALVIKSDRAVYKTGETARLSVLSTAKDARVLLDVTRGGASVLSTALDLRDGQASVELPIGEDQRGLILCEALALRASGQVIRSRQRILVDAQDRLQLTLEPDRAEYGPGQEATIRVRAKDASGTPKVASIGLTVVDEAVFALGGEPKLDLFNTFGFDPRVMPADTAVLGRSVRDLYAPNDAAAMEDLARLLFASAKDKGAAGFEYNSIREDLPGVQEALTVAVRRDAVKALKALMSWAKSQSVLTDQVLEKVAINGINAWRDPFGQPYAAVRGGSPGNKTLKVTSRGPDEQAGTPDDVAVNVWYGWVAWGDDAQVDADGNAKGGFGRGVGAADNAPNAEAMAGGPPVPQAPPQDPGATSANPAPARVRRDFRETAYVNPTLITGANGEAAVTVKLADSITRWRVSADGSSRDGKIGTARAQVRTFQDFFVDFSVPTNLTRGDVLELPAVVYNYLSEATSVQVSLDPAPWFELQSPARAAVTLGPSEVRSVTFTIRVLKAGRQELTLRAQAGNLSDALVREAAVLPDGAPEDQSYSDRLNGTRQHPLTLPADAIEGGTDVSLTLTPGFAGEAVAGTDALLKEPGGCFEQTTSSAWPNTMVARYLDTTGQMTPELRAKVVDLVTRGYQRLLTFESPTGGYNWWGNDDPGNRILSAIMLWHLKDMEGVVETDPAVRDRTLTWLLAQQRSDGSWASGDALHAGNEVLSTSDARTTAFITWALAHTGWAQAAVDRAIAYLAAQSPSSDDLYATALEANAFAVVTPNAPAALQRFQLLDAKKADQGEGRVSWPSEKPSWTGAGGHAVDIETTGLVAYGLLSANALPEAANGAIRFLVANKDAVGSWYNTQATMNALRALLAAASPRGSEAEGTLTVRVNGRALAPIAVTREQGDVQLKIDLSSYLTAGENSVELDMQGTGELSYRLSRRVYRPRTTPAQNPELALSVAYASTQPVMGQAVRVNVNAQYRGEGTRDQVMVRIGRAPGFMPRTEQLDTIVSSGRAARYEINERDVTFYVMGLASGQPRDLSFDLTPTLVYDGETPTSVVYVYYEPTVRAEVAPVALQVSR